ncbi:MAG: MBL fold metallo-hydrolase [Deltaproteobacteria bacterium]|jgi:metallo-beta-lactamase family protein|nr:MBL fold metallo-hydrolase [Deltaproteobacteria bacterium]MCL5880400.1 MBL fold metallo-hydrolase [Deltaproteobacteria bacterium]MDA8303672.1 MBL fold metallo-hydrolase [Deltaproteobacteria bacterium]
MIIKSFGAAKNVTGSCHLLTDDKDGINIMVDCGLFQERDFEDKNYELGFDPKKVDYLILTHAHIDHCGRIPFLVKSGFKGQILCTKPTYQLSKVLLLDTGKIMFENYKYELKKSLRKNEKKPELLYDESDVLNSFDFFNPVLEYDKPYDLKNGFVVEIRDAGHILGSSFVKIKRGDSSVIFSGDLGNKEKPIVKNFEYPDEADIVYTETTYGDRNHRSFQESKEEFLAAITDTLKNNGNVLIPSYATERAQDILYMLREFYEQGLLPSCKVFLDSPLALSVTDIFVQNLSYFKEDKIPLFKKGDPFDFPYLNIVRDIEESKQINNVPGRAIIIAGSGMLHGGRILHHLKHNIWKKENAVIFVGYQAKGTLGRLIVEKEKEVNILGERFKVNAQIYTINGFSSHADQNELMEWITAVKVKPQKVCLIHGDEDVMKVYKSKLVEKGFNVYMPDYGEEIGF